MKPQTTLQIISSCGSSTMTVKFHLESKKAFLGMCEEIYDSIINDENFIDILDEVENMTDTEKNKLYSTFVKCGGMEALYNNDKEAE